MLDSELEAAAFEGIEVDLLFDGRGPGFGDLFTICGHQNPHFPPERRFAFESLASLQFDQVDDYFGVRTSSGEGDDVAVWLYPLIGGEPVHHHPGPFDGLRVAYNVLRNPIDRADHFVTVVDAMARELPLRIVYRTRARELARAAALEAIRDDVRAIARHWQARGIRVGSGAALAIDY